MDAEQQQQSSTRTRRNWSARLEEVLNDFEALQRFQSWMGVDDDSSEHPLRLHFAIIAHREMNARGDPRAAQLAKDIYSRFLRPRGGLCDFIGTGVRERLAQRLKEGGDSTATEQLFGECLAPLDTFLRKQHALFVQSPEFLAFFNEYCSLEMPSTSAAGDQNSPASVVPAVAVRRSRRTAQHEEKAPALTAHTLLRSQRDRQAMVPTGGGAGLFKPVSKFPYVGQAQTSKKDSAVSSSFSSEANRAGASHSLRQMRETQRRSNQQAAMLNTFPHLDHGARPREPSSSTAPFDHGTTDGRAQFATQLAQKLRHIELQLRQEECVNRQIDRINSAKQKDTKTSTRELLIRAGETAPEDNPLLGDEADDDVENYYRKRMMDSSSANNSAQQSPLAPQSRRTRRKSRGSCSPSERMAQMQPIAYAPPFAQLMSQSCYTASKQQQMVVPPPPFCFDVPPQFPQIPLGQEQQRHLASFPFVQQGQPFPMFPSAPPLSVLSQSVTGPSSSASKKQQPMITPNNNKVVYCCDNDGDTSGIGSMTTTHSGNSAPGNERQRAAMFRRARELSSGGGATDSRNGQPQSARTTAGKREQQHFGSLPRPAQQQHPPSVVPAAPKMAISYRDTGSGDGVPVVAHVPRKPITFREFRRFLSISSKDRRQFFFKTVCEDGSAPHQLLLVIDDAALLPMFEGRVTAECRAPLSDSD